MNELKKEYIYYGIIGAAGVFILGMALWWFWPRGPSLESPDQLQTVVVEPEAPPEQRLKAAQQLVQHGEAARPQIHRALADYNQRAYSGGGGGQSYSPPVPSGSQEGVYFTQETDVRVELIKAVQVSNDWESIPELFRMMEDPDPKVRGRAGAAAQQLMGASFGFKATDPPKKRAEVIQMMRMQFDRKKDRIREHYEKRK